MKRIMTLILLTGLCSPLAWAARAPLTEPQLSRELQLLEEGFQPDRIFRLRIAALVASKDEYPLDVQGRIVRLQCWAMPAGSAIGCRRPISSAFAATCTPIRGSWRRG